MELTNCKLGLGFNIGEVVVKDTFAKAGHNINQVHYGWVEFFNIA
jgi:hypothetical protein